MSTAPVHDPVAERALLGAAMRSPAAADLAATLISGPDFYEPRHEDIWNAVRKLRHESTPATVQALTSELSNTRITGLDLFNIESECVTSEPASVRHAAGIIRGYATRRRLADSCRRIIQKAESPATDPVTLASEAAAEIAAVRDSGDEDVEIRTLGEIMSTEETPYDWVIPGLLERRDRLVITGGEGLGKSALLRQIGICAAAGIHPLTQKRMDPVKVVLIDVENSETQFRRQSRALVTQARYKGDNPEGRMFADFPGRMDITSDRALSRLHRTIDAVQPDMMIIGPLYRLSPKAIQTDDEATPVLVALDSIRDRGVSLVVEAHAGHAQTASGERNYRPRGSSALLGWPEFGYGVAPDPDARDEDERRIVFRPWRGDREERDFPTYLKGGGDFPWTPIRTSDSGAAWQPL